MPITVTPTAIPEVLRIEPPGTSVPRPGST